MVHVHVSRFSLDKPENGESWWLIAKELEKEDDGRRKLEFPYETSHARIKLDSVVGIGFELSTDHQAVADWALGYITIVSKRAHSTTYKQWCAWARLLLVTFITAFVSWDMAGPVTSVLLMGAWSCTIWKCALQIPSNHLRDGARAKNHRICTSSPPGKSVRQINRTRICKAAAASRLREGQAEQACPPWINWVAGSSCIFYCWAYALPFVGGWALQWGVAATACLGLTWAYHRDREAFVKWLQLGPDGPLLMHVHQLPKPQKPIQFVCKPEEMRDLMHLREDLYEKSCGEPRYRHLITDVSVGSYWVETVCSILLWSGLYESNRWRKRARLLTGLILPAFFVLQGLATLVPWLWMQQQYVVAMAHRDFGVRSASWAWHAVRMTVEPLVRHFIPAIPIWETCSRLFNVLTAPVRNALLATCRSLLRVASEFQSWALYLDHFLVYASASLARVRKMFRPLIALCSRISLGCNRMFRPLIALCSRICSSKWASRLAKVFVPIQKLAGLCGRVGKSMGLAVPFGRLLGAVSGLSKALWSNVHTARSVTQALHAVSPRSPAPNSDKKKTNRQKDEENAAQMETFCNNQMGPVLQQWMSDAPSKHRTQEETKAKLNNMVVRGVSGIVAQIEETQNLLQRSIEPFVCREQQERLRRVQLEANELSHPHYIALLEKSKKEPGFDFEDFCAEVDQVDVDHTETDPGQLYPQRRPDGSRQTCIRELFTAAKHAKPMFETVVNDLVECMDNRAISLIAPLKKMFRVLQKAATTTSGFDRTCDIVRGSIKCSSMPDIKIVLENLVKFQAARRVRLVRIKNRFKEPTDAGWADLMINFVCLGGENADACCHVCEVQIVILSLMTGKGHYSCAVRKPKYC
jgi:hypothetical protein